MLCPNCECKCYRDEVDVGVGTINGPWGCPNCGWSDDEEYNLLNKSSEVPGGTIDQYGGFIPKKRES